ncbi:MAG: hypothetical protein ACW98X_25015 [Promethearchaeota archaeon]|jgi:hypothetical protein
MANRPFTQIFLASETSGDITSVLTQATGDAVIYSREILEDSDSTTERVLILDSADDDASTPTIQISISLYIGGSWTDYESIASATAVANQFVVLSYDTSWWKKNNGVKFQITKAGAGAVTHTGYWI